MLVDILAPVSVQEAGRQRQLHIGATVELADLVASSFIELGYARAALTAARKAKVTQRAAPPSAEPPAAA